MNRPSGSQPTADGVARYPYFCTPLSKRERAAVMDNLRIASTVVQLNIWRGPSAILRLVIAIVVDTIKRMSVRWSQSHVGQKVFEGTAPPFAHSDASSSVAPIGWPVRVFATRAHVRPCDVFSCIRFSMRPTQFDYRASALASARRCFAVAKVAPSGGRSATAFALTNPVKALAFLGVSVARLNHRKLAELTPDCDVYSRSSHLGDFTLSGVF